MVIIFPAQVAETPVGNPFAPETPEFEIPVAPVVAWVTLVIAVLIHTVGVAEATPTVLFGFTVIVPVAFTAQQPPVNGIL